MQVLIMLGDTLATHGSELTLGSFRLPETGLTPIGSPTIEEWSKLVKFGVTLEFWSKED
jgi:hypothetical protein